MNETQIVILKLDTKKNQISGGPKLFFTIPLDFFLEAIWRRNMLH